MGRVTTRYNYKDLVPTGLAFSGVEITDAGSDTFYFTDLHAILADGFSLNTQADGLGTDITGFELSEENETLTKVYGKTVYEKITITDPTYQTGTIYATGFYSGDVNFAEYYNDLQGQIDALASGTSAVLIGSLHWFPVYEDLSAYGLLSFAFDNAISQANYPALWNKIGHIYNSQHLAAGDADLSESSTMFYPTPIPGAYNRVGVPDSVEIDGTTDISSTVITLSEADVSSLKLTRGVLPTGANGVPIRVKGTIPSELDTEITYYIAFLSATTISLHTTEANAVSASSAITMTSEGTFCLTQEGIVLDDAMQAHIHTSLDRFVVWNNGDRYQIPTTDDNVDIEYPENLDWTGYAEDGSNGTPRPTNETRPKTNISFGYIKVEHVTTSGEPIGAIQYIQDWSSTSTWTPGNSITITHDWGVPFDEYTGQVFVREVGTEDKIYNITNYDIYVGASPYYYGQRLNSISGSLTTCALQVGAKEGRYVKEDGSSATVPTSGWEYKVVLTQILKVATYADTSFRKVFNITTGDNQTFTLPDASTQLTEFFIKRKGSGAGVVNFATYDSQTINGNPASSWGLKGESSITLLPVGGNWEVKDMRGFRFHVQDQKTAGTDGGTFTSGAWRTRDLNTEVKTSLFGASLSSNQITLLAGVYKISGNTPAYSVSDSKNRLYNITDNSLIFEGGGGKSHTSNVYTSNNIPFKGDCSFESTSIIELQHQCASTKTSNGFGTAMTFTVDHETYSDITIEKIG